MRQLVQSYLLVLHKSVYPWNEWGNPKIHQQLDEDLEQRLFKLVNMALEGSILKWTCTETVDSKFFKWTEGFKGQLFHLKSFLMSNNMRNDHISTQMYICLLGFEQWEQLAYKDIGKNNEFYLADRLNTIFSNQVGLFGRLARIIKDSPDGQVEWKTAKDYHFKLDCSLFVDNKHFKEYEDEKELDLKHVYTTCRGF